jgi:hypothetical protein
VAIQAKFLHAPTDRSGWKIATTAVGQTIPTREQRKHGTEAVKPEKWYKQDSYRERARNIVIIEVYPQYLRGCLSRPDALRLSM